MKPLAKYAAVFLAGLGIGSWTVPFCDFVTQAVLGHSPLNPKEK